MDPLIDALHWRFATKEFSNKKVPQEEIDYLLEATRLAPSSFNIQPWKVIHVADKGLLHELLPVMWNQPQVQTTQDLFVFCANAHLNDAFDQVVHSMKQHGAKEEQIQGYVTMVRDFIKTLDHTGQSEFAQRQLYIALGTFLVAAAQHQIDAGPMEGIDREGVRKTLGLPAHITPYAAVAIGYRVDDPSRPKSRISHDQMYEHR